MLDYALLDALAAVVRHGSFDRAASELNVTPSAVSQRVKLLEERVTYESLCQASGGGTPSGVDETRKMEHPQCRRLRRSRAYQPRFG